MLKRIAIVAFFTGSGQLLSIFVLKWVSQYAGPDQLRGIAEIDSLFFFVMSLIGFGLQSAAMRNLAQSHDWKQEYEQTQSARFTLGMLMVAAALLALVNKYYLLFLLSPIVALSGDYALYARGYPVQGSLVAFARLLVPFLAILAGVFLFQANAGWVYAIALLITYLVTNAAIARFLGTKNFYQFSFKNLHLYVTSFPLGVVTVCMYMLGLGLLLVIPYLYVNPVVAVSFLGLKFYVLYKGVLRIINQAFLREMQSEAVCLQVDQLCMIAGILMAGSVLVFPESFISFFFGKQYLHEQIFFQLLGIDALLYSIFISHNTRALYLNADKRLATICLVAALATIISLLVLSSISGAVAGIAISLGIGEVIYAAGLVMIAGNRKQIANRFIFLAGIAVLLLIPLAGRYWFNDTLPTYAASFALLCVVILALHYRKFKLLSAAN